MIKTNIPLLERTICHHLVQKMMKDSTNVRAFSCHEYFDMHSNEIALGFGAKMPGKKSIFKFNVQILICTRKNMRNRLLPWHIVAFFLQIQMINPSGCVASLLPMTKKVGKVEVTPRWTQRISGIYFYSIQVHVQMTQCFLGHPCGTQGN